MSASSIITNRPHVAAAPAGDGARRARARCRGFTLIESALVTVIVGVGVLAIVAAQQAYHQQNEHAQRTGSALMLANEIRELMIGLPLHDPIYGDLVFGPETGENSAIHYDDIDDFAGPDGEGTLIQPPIDAARRTIPGMERWSQHVRVENVLASHISSSSPAPQGSTAVLRVTCKILYQGPNDDSPKQVTTLTWVRADK